MKSMKTLVVGFALLLCFQNSHAQNGASFDIPFSFIVGCTEPVLVEGVAKGVINPALPANGNSVFTFNVNAKGTGLNLITGETYKFMDNYHVTDHAGLVVNEREKIRLKPSGGGKNALDILFHYQVVVDANFQLKHFSVRSSCEEN